MASGASIPDILEPAAKSTADLPLLADLFSQVAIRPTPERYRRYHARVGDDGVAVAFMSLAAGPAQHVMRDLMRLEDFFLATYDAPELLEALYEPLAALYEQIVAATAASDAEVALLGANYDEAVTCPPFFAERITPWLRRASERLHAQGKYLLTHTDGENRGLMAELLRCGVDVADSVCPSPMTKLSAADYRRAFDGKTTIWGAVPSVMMLECSCSDANFRRHLDGLFRDFTPYDHSILSVADTAPPDMAFDRLLRLRDSCLGG